MPKDALIYVGHMLDTAALAVRKVQGLGHRQFDEDENLRLALTHLIQTFGEAARHVSAPFQQSHPNIPWAKIIGMRRKVVHDYLHVDYDLVWDVATRELPGLVDALGEIAPPDA